MLLFLHPGMLIRNTDSCLFYRLKINHDSQEFILESGTVANTTKQDNFVQSQLPSEKDYMLCA
jgi:hypothetical protein